MANPDVMLLERVQTLRTVRARVECVLTSKSVLNIYKYQDIRTWIFLLRNPSSQEITKKDTVWPRSRDPFYIVSYCIKWAKISWTYSRCIERERRIRLNIKWVKTSWTYSRCIERERRIRFYEILEHFFPVFMHLCAHD